MTISEKSKSNNYLDISFSSSKWDYIKAIREFINSYLSLNSLNNEDVSKVIVAASELLENALKYNISGEVRTRLKKNLEQNQIEYQVENFSEKKDADKATQIISDIQNSTDPFLYYIELMRDKTSRSKKGGGLGLARIAAEAKAELTYEYDEKNKLLKINAILKF